MLELIAGLSLWTLAYVGVTLLVLTVFVECEQGLAALFVLVAAIVVPAFLGYASVPAWVYENPWRVLVIIPAYVALGVVWMLFKWRGFVSGRVDRTREDIERLKSSGVSFDEFVSSYRYNSLHPANHVDRLCRWMAWWPVSLASFVLGDMMREVWRFTYSQVEGVLIAVMKSRLGEK